MSALSRVLKVILLAVALAGCKQELYNGLTQRDANEMIALLESKGIEAIREKDGDLYKVLVENAKFGRSVEILSAEGLPRTDFRTIDQIFPGDRMVMTPFEQKIRMKFALDQELSRAVTALGGVLDASVHVVLPETDFRGEPITKPTASVLIRTGKDADMPVLTAQIRLLVTNAVPGIEYDNVAVIRSVSKEGADAGQPVP